MLDDRHLRDYVEGGLLPAQAAEVERLLADDTGSLREVIAQQQIDAALRAVFGDASAEKWIAESIVAIMRETPLAGQKSKTPHPASPRARPAVPKVRPAKSQSLATLAGIAIAACVFIFWMIHQFGYIARIDAAGTGTEIVRSGKTGSVRAGTLLRKEDILRVAESATVEYPDATLLTLGPASSAIFATPVSGKCDKCVKVVAGSLSAVVRTSQLPMILTSGHVVASMSKGSLALVVDSTRTRVEVSSGTLHIERQADKQTADLNPGEFVEVATAGDITPHSLDSAAQPAEPAEQAPPPARAE